MCMSFIACGRRATEPTSILFIGLQGSGKSSLLEQVSATLGGQPMAADWLPTPTYGLDVRSIKPRKDVIGGPLMLRELGGCMQRIWPQYYSDTHAVLLVVDTSCQDKLAAAAVTLLELSQHPGIQGKPLCVAFNKCDQPLAVPLAQLHVAFNLSAIAASYPGSFCSLHTSATTGKGATDVVAWMGACQQQVAQQAAAASKGGTPRASLLGGAADADKAAVVKQQSVGRASGRKRNSIVPVWDEEPAAPAATAATDSTAAAAAGAADTAAAAQVQAAAGSQQAGDSEEGGGNHGEGPRHSQQHLQQQQQQQQQPTEQEQQQQQQQSTEQATCIIQVQGQQPHTQLDAQAPKQQVMASSSAGAGQPPHEQCIMPGVAS